VLHQIGSGVLGPVFRTYDPQADALVAVKVFRLDLLPEDVARLADGLRRLAGAPGFVAAGLENTSAYLATDYLAGETLDVALRHLAPAPLETALPILERAAALIDASWEHGAPFGHGALHPRDIFITPDSHDVAITGFGVVPALEHLGAKPPVRRPYTAPERAHGDAWDIRADIYSLAAIAHELLTGRRPAGPSEQDGALLASMPPTTRAHIRRVLSKALAESPAQRFRSAAEFVSALGDLSALPEPIVASAQPTPTFIEAAVEKPEPEPLTLLPVAELTPPSFGTRPLVDKTSLVDTTPLVDTKNDEFDLTHVIRQDIVNVEPPADLPLEKPVEKIDKPAVNRGSKSRTVAMPVVKPRERADVTPAPAFDEPKFRAEPELIRTPAPQFSMPPATPWAAMIAIAIACLILGAAIDHQWMLSSFATATEDKSRGGASPSVVTAPPAAADAGKTAPPKETGRADTEVAVTEPATPAVKAPDVTPPPPKPADKTRPGKITIRSVPAGATVTIDGKAEGRTPLVASGLSLAGHTVVVARPGFASDTRRIMLTRRAPAATVAASLKAERRSPSAPPAAGAAARTPAPAAPGVTTGSVAIDSRPRGARITIDGRALGQSPVSVPGLTPGAHALRLELEGYKPLASTFIVKAGETTRVAVTLEIK